MKTSFFALSLTLMTFAAQAASFGEVFGPLEQYQESRCFTRTYSAQHLQTHPKQTVKAIKAKISFRRGEFGGEPMMHIEVLRKDNVLLRQATWCSDDNVVNCGVDADGGSVVIAGISQNSLQIKNGQFGVRLNGAKVLRSEWLKNTIGGDDVFNLNLASPKDCKDIEKFMDEELE